MIALSSDHAGYPLKEEIRAYLDAAGVEYKDCGAFGTASVDYPVQAKKACDLVVDGTCDMAILCCGTGVGMSMAANKIKGIRAACCSDTFSTFPFSSYVYVMSPISSCCVLILPNTS